MKVFLDANVLFAAAWHDAAVRALLKHAQAQGFGYVVDQYVVDEASRNLADKRPDVLTTLGELLIEWSIAICPEPSRALVPSVLLHEEDMPVLAAAIESGCQALLTGDRRHFGQLYGTEVHGVTIHSMVSFAELLSPPGNSEPPG